MGKAKKRLKNRISKRSVSVVREFNIEKHDNRIRIVTDYLFPTPSLLIGAGSVLNLWGNYFEYNTCETGLDADQMALENDFKMIGQDIEDAIEEASKF